MLNLSGKRIVVTGGGAGIGLAITEHCVAAGATVVACDVDAAALAALPSNGSVYRVKCDVANADSVDHLFENANRMLGGLDALVNNVGIMGPVGPTESIDFNDWSRTLHINVTSMFLCSRKAIPFLKRNRGGSIVNLSSGAAKIGLPFRAAYVTSKAAVIGLAKSLANELGEHNIRVNAILPGAVEGERLSRVFSTTAQARNQSLAEVEESFLKLIPLRRFISAADIATMTAFLISDAGANITGEAISVSAGA